MAEKKAPIERKIVSAKSGKEIASGAGKVAVSVSHKGKAGPLRIGAFGCWLVGILFEVLAVLILNGTFHFGNPAAGTDNTMMLLIGALVIDLIFVVIGSQLWKKANDMDPASEKDKVKFFLWNNLGVIISIIAFLPIIILLLSNKNLDKKTKTIVTAVAAVALVIAGATSFDYNPASQEDLQAAQEAAAQVTDGTVYWTPFGKAYHFDANCSSLLRSATVYSGSMDEAFAANRNKPCSFCAADAVAVGGTADVVEATASEAEQVTASSEAANSAVSEAADSSASVAQAA